MVAELAHSQSPPPGHKLGMHPAKALPTSTPSPSPFNLFDPKNLVSMCPFFLSCPCSSLCLFLSHLTFANKAELDLAGLWH